MTPDDAFRRILDASFVIRVSHVGRKTGRPRVLETTYYWDGRNKIYLSGYPGRRDWVANMSANPNLTLYTVEGGIWMEARVLARVVRNRRERMPFIINYVEHWSRLPGGQRRTIGWTLRMIRINRALRLPWWGPFYLIRRIFDRMPCVELTLTGPPARRNTPPPEPTMPQRGV